jgi:hypothetical protein
MKTITDLVAKEYIEMVRIKITPAKRKASEPLSPAAAPTAKCVRFDDAEDFPLLSEDRTRIARKGRKAICFSPVASPKRATVSDDSDFTVLSGDSNKAIGEKRKVTESLSPEESPSPKRARQEDVIDLTLPSKDRTTKVTGEKERATESLSPEASPSPKRTWQEYVIDLTLPSKDRSTQVTGKKGKVTESLSPSESPSPKRARQDEVGDVAVQPGATDPKSGSDSNTASAVQSEIDSDITELSELTMLPDDHSILQTPAGLSAIDPDITELSELTVLPDDNLILQTPRGFSVRPDKSKAESKKCKSKESNTKEGDTKEPTAAPRQNAKKKAPTAPAVPTVRSARNAENTGLGNDIDGDGSARPKKMTPRKLMDLLWVPFAPRAQYNMLPVTEALNTGYSNLEFFRLHATPAQKLRAVKKNSLEKERVVAKEAWIAVEERAGRLEEDVEETPGAEETPKETTPEETKEENLTENTEVAPKVVSKVAPKTKKKSAKRQFWCPK